MVRHKGTKKFVLQIESEKTVGRVLRVIICFVVDSCFLRLTDLVLSADVVNPPVLA